MRFTEYGINELTEIVIGKAIEVHRVLEPGLPESAYQECLLHKITDAGLCVDCEVGMPIVYKDLVPGHGYRMDLLAEDTLAVELKPVEKFSPVHFAQRHTYLRLGKYPAALLINSHVDLLKNGIKRIAL